MENISFSIAFTGGLLTFFTPCIFPLIPPYLAFVAGLSLSDIEKRNLYALLEIVSFLIGISIIFLLLGYSAGSLGKLIIKNKQIIRFIGGSLAILLGIQFILDKYLIYLGPKSKATTNKKNLPILGSFLLGFSFGLGWSPCIGPILASILLYAASTENPWEGAKLLLGYALGFCIPLLITGIALSKAFDIFGRLIRYSKLIRIASGSGLILMGMVMTLC